MKKLFIKTVRSTTGGPPGLHLDVNCTDGTSYVILRRGVTRSMFHDATIAVLQEDKKVISMVLVDSFDKSGRPKQYKLIRGEDFILDGTEEIVDCR